MNILTTVTPENIEECISSCDKRIKLVQDNLSSWEMYSNLLGLVNLEIEKKYQDKINNCENNMKLIQVEKIIYKALLKRGNNSLFPRLLAKYDDLMENSYDLSGNMVITGLNFEGDHLEYCSQSLAQREYIKKMCLYGEKRLTN